MLPLLPTSQRSFGEHGYSLTLDVGNATEAVSAVGRIVRERGRVDILVNNAEF